MRSGIVHSWTNFSGNGLNCTAHFCPSNHYWMNSLFPFAVQSHFHYLSFSMNNNNTVALVCVSLAFREPERLRQRHKTSRIIQNGGEHRTSLSILQHPFDVPILSASFFLPLFSLHQRRMQSKLNQFMIRWHAKHKHRSNTRELKFLLHKWKGKLTMTMKTPRSDWLSHLIFYLIGAKNTNCHNEHIVAHNSISIVASMEAKHAAKIGGKRLLRCLSSNGVKILL